MEQSLHSLQSDKHNIASDSSDRYVNAAIINL